MILRPKGKKSKSTEVAKCHKCGHEGAVPREVLKDFGAGLDRHIPLKAPECVDTAACDERAKTIRWKDAVKKLRGQQTKCWVCHQEGIIGDGLVILADMLYVEEDKFGEIFAGFKWGHANTQLCSK